jgi:hypothetical protein
MLGEVGLSAQREIGLPCCLEGGAGRVEAFRCTAAALSPLIERVEANAPAPLVGMDGHPWADRDVPDVDIAEIDVPAVRAFGLAAAGEGGHGT